MACFGKEWRLFVKIKYFFVLPDFYFADFGSVKIRP